MAATVVAFVPSETQNFTFQATFDGIGYQVVVTWNLFALRFYVNVFTLAGQRVFSIPLIGSPPDANVSLTAGYFTTTLVYRASSGNFEIT